MLIIGFTNVEDGVDLEYYHYLIDNYEKIGDTIKINFNIDIPFDVKHTNSSYKHYYKFSIHDTDDNDNDVRIITCYSTPHNNMIDAAMLACNRFHLPKPKGNKFVAFLLLDNPKGYIDIYA